jgi:hypothetical protein
MAPTLSCRALPARIVERLSAGIGAAARWSFSQWRAKDLVSADQQLASLSRALVGDECCELTEAGS